MENTRGCVLKAESLKGRSDGVVEGEGDDPQCAKETKMKKKKTAEGGEEGDPNSKAYGTL